MSVTTQRNRRKTPSTKPVLTPLDAGAERPMEILEARIERLEAAVQNVSVSASSPASRPITRGAGSRARRARPQGARV